jgi:uncharacterized protein (DUF58 family)
VNDSASLIPKAMTAFAKRRKRLGVAFGPRFLLLALIGFLWLIPTLFHWQFIYGLILWDLILLAGWGFDLSKLPRPAHISITRSWNSPPALAVANKIELTLNNAANAPLRASLLDNVPVQLRPEVPEIKFIAPAHGTISKSYDILPMHRGNAMLGAVYIRYRSFFQLAERWAMADLHQKICVYPNLEEARRHSIYLIRSRQIELEKRHSRIRGQGREFESLREYRDGDEFRNICWRASARRGKLITRLFQSERSQTIWLVIDSGRLMRTKIFNLSKLDFAVDAALSLGQVALGSGDRVGLLAYGRSVRHRVMPYRGGLHLRKLIEQLALVQEESSESDHLQAMSVLMSTQMRRSLIVWITDLAETAMTPEVIEAAGQMLSRHVVIFIVIGQPDLGKLAAKEPESASQMYLTAAAQEIIHRREVLLAKLRRHGAIAIEVDYGEAATAAVNSYLEVKQRNLI